MKQSSNGNFNFKFHTRVIKLKQSPNWLRALPAKDREIILNRGEFTDALNLKYYRELRDTTGLYQRYYRELRDTTENSEILQRTQRYYRELRDTTENSEILQRTQRYYRELRDTTENSEIVQRTQRYYR